MKQWRFLLMGLIVCVISACEALGTRPQSANPNVNEQNISTPLLPPTQREQVTFPQMTQTALMFPTALPVTETTPSLDELINSYNKTTSPNNKYVIVCGAYLPALIDITSNTVISSSKDYFDCNDNQAAWSSDSSYVLFDRPENALLRWRTDGSLPEVIELNIQTAPPGPTCDSKLGWNSTHEYLALIKNCGLYVINPNDETSFINPIVLVECAGCFYDFRWFMSNALIMEFSKVDAIVQIPSGNVLGGVITSGGGCPWQIPLISPDGHWIAYDAPWCGGGEPGKDQFLIGNFEDGTERVFSESFSDRIDLLGWSEDSSRLYLISRPTAVDAFPDPRTPFGLLAMNPETLEVQHLFDQAMFVEFDKDHGWAYVVFPSKNEEGTLRLDGGLWEEGTTKIIGRQVMANTMDDRYLAPFLDYDAGYLYSPSGEQISYASFAPIPQRPAIWSHDNTQAATINASHQLVVININGDVRILGQLRDDKEWLDSEIVWSKDDQTVIVDGIAWPVPQP